MNLQAYTLNQDEKSQADLVAALLALLVRSKKLYPYGIPETFLKDISESNADLEIARWGSEHSELFTELCIIAQVQNVEQAFSCQSGQLLLSIIEKGLKLKSNQVLVFALKDQQQITQEMYLSLAAKQRLIIFGEVLLNFQASTELKNTLVTHSLLDIQNNAATKRSAWESLKEFMG